VNRAYLRPPVPLYQVVAALLSPLVIWGAVSMWSRRLPELERLYLGDYLQASFVPDLSAIANLVDFGAHKKAAPAEYEVLICYTIRGQEVPATGELQQTLHPHPAVVPMKHSRYATWLRRNIYGGEFPVTLVLPSLLIGVLLAAILWTGAWFLDQERHLKFRSQGRQLRGPVMRTRAGFARVVKGDGIGWRIESRRSAGELMRSVWIAISHSLHGEKRRALRELITGRRTKVLRIDRQLETQPCR